MSRNHSFQHSSFLSIPARLGLVLALPLATLVLLTLFLLPIQPASDLPPEFYYEGAEPGWTCYAGYVDDECVSDSTVPIGFDSTYWGTVYTETYVYVNGFIALGAGGDYCPDGSALCLYSNLDIPREHDPNAFIAPFWDDLDFSETGGEIYYVTIGTAPNRKFVVQWTNAGFF